jgi:hypothetical protein
VSDTVLVVLTKQMQQTPHIKVTIEVEGPPADVVSWLRQLPTDADPMDAEATWTPELAERLVSEVSPKARKVLRHLAQGAPEVAFKQLQHALKVDGVALGGIMASFGFAERRGIPRPYRVDHVRRVYYMDHEVADLVLDALREF